MMKSSYKIIIVVVVGLLLVGGVLLLNGWFSGSKDTHPPCEQLPSVDEAADALDNHQDLSEEIEALGDGITVEVGLPCSDDQSRGLVMVKYNSKAERNAIDGLLSQSNGFGVPVHLVKR